MFSLAQKKTALRYFLVLGTAASFLLLPSAPFFIKTTAHTTSAQELQRQAKPEPGPPVGIVPNLDEVRTQRPSIPHAPQPIESTIRSKKNELVPWDGRKVGDPIERINAPSPAPRSPQPVTPMISDSPMQSSLTKTSKRRKTRSHHPSSLRDSLSLATPYTLTEDAYIQNFFSVALNRAVSSTELSYWRDVLRSGSSNNSLILAAQELGRTIFQSGEYAARNTDARTYVSNLYGTYLYRGPDEPAWTAWANYAAGPPEQRENTRHGFEYSTEFYNLLATLTFGGAASSTVGSLSSARVDLQNQPGSGLLGRSMDWSVPLVSLPGRAGLDLSLSLSYSSQVWTPSGPHIYFDEDNGFPSAGFHLGFPTISAQSFDAQVGKKTYVFSDSSGRRVELRQIGTTNNYEAADSSYLLLVDNGNYLLVYGNDGTLMTYNSYNGEWRCTQIKDPNGNIISTYYDSFGHPGYIIDSLGRSLYFDYDSNSNLTQIRQTWSGNQTHQWAIFQWANRTLSSSLTGMVGIKTGDSIPVITRVTFADSSHYAFEYNSCLQVSEVRHADSDTVERASTTYTYDTPTTDSPRVTSSSVSATNWTSVNGLPSALVTTYDGSGTPHTLTTSDGTVYKEYYGTGWQKGLVTQTEITSGGSTVKTTTTSYDQDNTSVNYLVNPRATETNIYDGTNHRRTTIDYSSTTIPTGTVMKLPSDVKEYLADGTTVYRRTHTDFLGTGDYINRRILMLPSASLLYDGGNSLASKVAYVYDDGGEFLVNTAATPTQHDSNYGTGFTLGRGNLTQVKQYDITDPANETKVHAKKMGYDIDGSVVFTRDALNHQNTISYADSFSDNTNRNTFAYPTTLTDPDGGNSTVKYNFDFGGKTYRAGPAPANQSQGAIQTVAYDSIGRVERTTTSNNGAYTRYVYGGYYVQSFSTINNVADDAYHIQVFDGVGRVVQEASYHPGSTGGYKAKLTYYDSMGRPMKASNPTEINSSWIPAGDDAAGWLYTLQTYDWKGRPLQTTHPDNTYNFASYAGCGCAGGEVVTLTDEGTSGGTSRREQKIYSDVFGRTRKTEISNWAGGTVYSSVVNIYNVRDQITNVTQYAGPENSSPNQASDSTYDQYGRLWTKHVPEQSPGTVTTFTYNADDTLNTVTDGRGAVSTYGYAGTNRGLVKSLSQTLSGSSTISTTFDYDTVGNRIGMSHSLGGVLKDSLSISYDQLSRATSESRYIAALAGSAPNYGNYSITYGSYNLANQLQSITDSFTSTTTLTYDTSGSTTNVSGSFGGTNYTYANNIAYRAWGAVKSATLGGYSEAITYDSSRMRPTAFQVNSGSMMNYQYTYFDSGQLKEFKDLADQVGDPHSVQFHYMSRALSYDQAGRVSSAGQLPNSSVLPPFTGSYGYDEFNNLTSRNGKYALNSSEADSSTYTNNRRAGWTYNGEGLITASSDTSDIGGSSTRTWTYDAAGKPLTISEIRNSVTTTNTMAYDGDGQLIYESVNGSPSDYLIRSSVLGTVLTKLTSTGGKDITYVPTNGLVAAMQNQNPGFTPFMSWVIRDATGVQEWQSNSAYSSNAYDPLGNLVHNVQPPLSGPPPYVPMYGATYGGASWNTFSNANNLAAGCNVGGMSTDCRTAAIGAMGLDFANVLGLHLDNLQGEVNYAHSVALQVNLFSKDREGVKHFEGVGYIGDDMDLTSLPGPDPQNSDRLPGTNMTACLVMADIAQDVAQAAGFRDPKSALSFFDQEFSRLYHGGPIRSIADAQKWANGTGRAPEMAFYAQNGSGFQERYRDTGTEGGLIGGRDAEQTHHFSFNLSAGINARVDIYEAGQWGIRPSLNVPIPDNAGDVRLGEAAFNQGVYLRRHQTQLKNIGKWIRRNICTNEGHGLYYPGSNPQ